MLTDIEVKQLLAEAEQIVTAEVLTAIIDRMAKEITSVLSDQYPLVFCVMGGAVVFTGQLLPLLNFPLDFDYLHVTRYNRMLQGGRIHWKVSPQINLKERVVLVLDDVLDEGLTLAAIRQRMLDGGAKAFYSAVLADKTIGQAKPIYADFIGVSLPNRYIFGYGMDIRGCGEIYPQSML